MSSVKPCTHHIKLRETELESNSGVRFMLLFGKCGFVSVLKKTSNLLEADAMSNHGIIDDWTRSGLAKGWVDCFRFNPKE